MRSRVQSSKRYIGASAFVNSLGYLIYCLIQYSFNPSKPVISFLVSALLMLLPSFAVNSLWVFQSGDIALERFLKFSGTYSGAIFAGAFVLTAMHAVIENAYFAQLISTLLVGSATFCIHSFWTFETKT